MREGGREGGREGRGGEGREGGSSVIKYNNPSRRPLQNFLYASIHHGSCYQLSIFREGAGLQVVTVAFLPVGHR